MGFYTSRVLPRILNVTCGIKEYAPLRARVCQGLAGEIIELDVFYQQGPKVTGAESLGVAAVPARD